MPKEGILVLHSRQRLGLLQLACVARKLVNSDADVNAQGGHFGSTLQAACFRGNEAIVRLLLETGADVNAQGGRYSTALQTTCSRKHKAIVKPLLEAGADVNAQGNRCRSALRSALEGHGNPGNRLKIVTSLLEHGADADSEVEGDEKMIRALSVKNYDLLARLLVKKKKRTRLVNSSVGR
jgi:ankyrin repeat protein